MEINKAYVGKWRITEREQWDKDYIDLVVPGHLTIDKDGTGLLQFGAVEAEVDYRVVAVGGTERLDLSFVGADEGDPVSGRGWAQVAGPSMTGRLYFHLGDHSAFAAARK